MKEDYKLIKALIDKNEYFYRCRNLEKKEFIKNSLFLAGRLETILEENQRFSIKVFQQDEFSVVKFKLAIGNLKAVIN